MRFILPCFFLLAVFGFAQKVDVGASAPGFELKDIGGKTWKLSDHADDLVVLEWINHGCPYVKKNYQGHMQALQEKFGGKGVVWFSIDSNRGCSADKGARLTAEAKANPAAYLLDPDGAVGKTYGAKQTPHMFVIHDGKVVYHGALDSADNTRVSDIDGAQHYVATAIEDCLAGRPVSVKPVKPYGCGIKYP